MTQVTLMTASQLHALHEAVLTTAQSNKFTLLLAHPHNFFQLDTSDIRVQNYVIILVHVPCFTSYSLLNIYRYARLPYPIDILPQPLMPIIPYAFLTHTIRHILHVQKNLIQLNGSNEAIYIIPVAYLIAIGHNTITNKHQYKLLFSADLHSYIQCNHVYLCKQHQVLCNAREPASGFFICNRQRG